MPVPAPNSRIRAPRRRERRESSGGCATGGWDHWRRMAVAKRTLCVEREERRGEFSCVYASDFWWKGNLATHLERQTTLPVSPFVERRLVTWKGSENKDKSKAKRSKR